MYCIIDVVYIVLTYLMFIFMYILLFRFYYIYV